MEDDDGYLATGVFNDGVEGSYSSPLVSKAEKVSSHADEYFKTQIDKRNDKFRGCDY